MAVFQGAALQPWLAHCSSHVCRCDDRRDLGTQAVIRLLLAVRAVWRLATLAGLYSIVLFELGLVVLAQAPYGDGQPYYPPPVDTGSSWGVVVNLVLGVLTTLGVGGMVAKWWGRRQREIERERLESRAQARRDSDDYHALAVWASRASAQAEAGGVTLDPIPERTSREQVTVPPFDS